VKTSDFNDETLLRLMARSQTDALSELYDRYSRLVFSVAFQTLGSRELAEEVTQDAFLRAWQHAASYQPSQGKVATWLASISRHRAIDVFRSQQVRPEGHSLSWDELPFWGISEANSEGNSIEDGLVEAGEGQRVRSALAQLPPDQQKALGLAYFSGMTQEQIAETLGQPLGTVKTRIRLGMQKLRLILGGPA